VLLAGAYTAAGAWAGSGAASGDTDTLTFVLPNLISWMQSGSVWGVHQFTPLLANGNYPHNGDLLLLGSVMPFDSDAFVRAAGLPFVAVTGLAVYALARKADAPRATSALVAAAVAALPVFQIAAFEGAKADIPMLATFGAGLVFLARHLQASRRSDLVLAGLGLGLAFGTKWYAVWSVAIVVVVWAGLALLASRQWRPVAARLAGVGVLILLVGGFWMLRNAIESGSPLYPTPVHLAGLTVFGTPHDFIRACSGYSIASYVDEPGIIRKLVYPAWRAGYEGPGLVLSLGWLAGTAWLVRDLRRGLRGGALPVIALCAVSAPLIAVVYVSAPYSAIGEAGAPFAQANLRWLLPAALPAAAVTAWALARVPRLRPFLEVAILVAVFDGLRQGLDVSSQDVALPGLGLAAVTAAAAGAVWLWRRGDGSRVAAAGLAGALVLVLGAAGYARQRHYAEHRYADADPVIQALARSGGSGRRVALAGSWGGGVLSPVLPAYGPRLRGHVQFVGHTVRHQLREYDRREDWLAAIRRGRFQYLVVGRNGYSPSCRVPGQETDDDAWARRSGFRPLAQSANETLYRIPAAG
jgi:hypothetical protein